MIATLVRKRAKNHPVLAYKGKSLPMPESVPRRKPTKTLQVRRRSSVDEKGAPAQRANEQTFNESTTHMTPQFTSTNKKADVERAGLMPHEPFMFGPLVQTQQLPPATQYPESYPKSRSPNFGVSNAFYSGGYFQPYNILMQRSDPEQD